MNGIAKNSYILGGMRTEEYRLSLMLVGQQVFTHILYSFFVKTVERLVKYQWICAEIFLIVPKQGQFMWYDIYKEKAYSFSSDPARSYEKYITDK